MSDTEAGLLAGRIALVTGGARARRRDRSHIRGERRARRGRRPGDGACPEGWISLVADVTNEGEVERAVADAVARFGRLDVVVANAGVVPRWSDTAELDLAALDRTLRSTSAGSRRR